jgi:hypothetical protein
MGEHTEQKEHFFVNEKFEEMYVFQNFSYFQKICVQTFFIECLSHVNKEGIRKESTEALSSLRTKKTTVTGDHSASTIYLFTFKFKLNMTPNFLFRLGPTSSFLKVL